MKLAPLLILLVACVPIDKPTQAALGYDAQQKACIDRHDTRAAIDACRDRVKAAWASDAGANEGGSP